MEHYKIASYYFFAPIADCQSVQSFLKGEAERLKLCGTTLVAPEGLNGTMAGSPKNINCWLDILRGLEGFSELEAKFTTSVDAPFFRAKIRLKKQIITMGDFALDPHKVRGTYLGARDWDSVISDPDVMVIDTRNDYEIKIGTFERAVDPRIDSFGEFPKWVTDNLDPAKHKKIAMFCTGGIRCEKASAYMLEQGFEEVYHLKGGILKYLEATPKEESKWQGECFVFDSRVSLVHGLEEGEAQLCFACRTPLMPFEIQHESYEEGVSCLYCNDKYTRARKEAFRERQKQQILAKSRNEKHIGKVFTLKGKEAL